MERQIHDKLEEILKEIRQTAEDDYESGHPMDSDDFNEFQKGLDESDLNINRLLFDYYYECFEEAKEEPWEDE